MKYKVRMTTRFKRDYKLAKKQHKDVDTLFDIVDQLANGEVLDEKYHDHPLVGGKYKGTRECHIEPDWLLVYQIIDDILVLSLNRLGSHSDLF